MEPGGPKMKPGCSTNRAKMEKNALNHQKWLPDSSQDPLTQKGSYIFSNFWVPPGTPKTTKNRCFPKKAILRNPFLSIFAAKVVCLNFLNDFGSILDENAMQDLIVFPGRSRIFFNMATLTKHCILQAKPHLLLSNFLKVFLKQMLKKRLQI